MQCPKCKLEIADRSKFCNHCGHKFNVCPKCGWADFTDEAIFCAACGTEFQGKEKEKNATKELKNELTYQKTTSSNMISRVTKRDQKKKLSFRKRLLKITIAGFVLLALSLYPLFIISRHYVNNYFDGCGNRLVNLDKRGLLSKEFGAGWTDEIKNEAMAMEATRITNVQYGVNLAESQKKVVDGIVLSDYPSLSIIDKLREVSQYSNNIEVVDRNDKLISSIRTDHQRAKINEFPPTLITALLAAEDKNFKENCMGYDYDRFVRAFLLSVYQSAVTFKNVPPKGTSTITMQVAKFLISQSDEQGICHVNRSVDRKIREIKLAVALRKMYPSDDILEVYINHCVTSDNGMIGYRDIARGLFNKDLCKLDDAQSIYLSRMVKWGENNFSKISAQCKIDMPRMGKALGWSNEKQAAVLAQIDNITFASTKRFQEFQGKYSPLVDLANEFWLLTLKHKGFTETQRAQMDLIDPNSLIRKKGNLKIKLTIDLSLQQILEHLVDARGYGPDTTIIDELRIGSSSETIKSSEMIRDTLWARRILREPIDFNEPGSAFITSLNPGDTVIVNICYKKTGHNEYNRSCYYYVKRPVVAKGQYFAYSIMDSRTGSLLAYYSKDSLGSRLACLLQNRTPNGASIAMPIMNALNFDMGNFLPYQRWNDRLTITDDVPWKRTLDFTSHGNLGGVIFSNGEMSEQGYSVHNKGNVFEGCHYIFDLLSTSNNILGAEMVYRLNHAIYDQQGEILPEAFPLVQFLSRIGSFSRLKDTLRISNVTGVRVYKELARIAGVNIDSMVSYGKSIPVSDSLYSIVLGTLDLKLYEQMHLFNCLYNNDVIEYPADHPSLAIENITLNGDTVMMNDTIRRYHPFADMNNIRPTLLGMHKQLVSNRADGLGDYDIAYTPTSTNTDNQFHPEDFAVEGPLSNIAKSGTTEDVIRPFNESADSKKRTNYGIWNAVIRVDFSRIAGFGPPDIRDITIACVGECNEAYTGERDGKTLHKFISQGLLSIAGVKAPKGFFSEYEKYLKKVTPLQENCGN